MEHNIEDNNNQNQNVCAHCGQESVKSSFSLLDNASTSSSLLLLDGNISLREARIRRQELAAQNLMQPSEEEASEWIFCDSCKKWYHALCVNVQQYELSLIDKYHCPSCTFEHGDSVMKVKLLSHRYAFDNENEQHLPMQVGSEEWIQKFAALFKEKFSEVSSDMIQLYDTGFELKQNFNFTECWTKPIKVKNKADLGILMPDDPCFDVSDIIKILGGHVLVDTIDVFAQRTHTMSLDRFHRIWLKRKRDRLYNILSLEFSETRLSDIVRSPSLVRELSWVYRFWPNDYENELNFRENKQQQTFDVYEFSDNPTWQKQCVFAHEEQQHHETSRPYVENFCLMGMRDSYTDFHIDFGGSSVWYHVFKGSKVFFIARSNEQNLDAFLKWQNHKQHSEQFFGDLLPDGEKLYRLHVNAGETLFLPSGWIHSVYTPEDSIVFGGNFLHFLNVPMQLKVFDMEIEANIDGRFRFPFFEVCNFYAAKSIVGKLKDCSTIGIPSDELTLDAANALLLKCMEWIKISPDKFNIFNGVVKQLQLELNRQKSLQEKTQVKKPKEKKSVVDNAAAGKAIQKRAKKEINQRQRLIKRLGLHRKK